MLKPKKVKFVYDLPKSYLAFIKNSVGSKTFKSFYVKGKSGPIDVLKDGELSCAAFASSILAWFGLTKSNHFTVARTVEDLLACGAKKVSLKSLRPGDVLVWNPEAKSTDKHNHIGFYVGRSRAVSNSKTTKAISEHHYTYKGKRPIEFALRPNLKNAHV